MDSGKSPFKYNTSVGGETIQYDPNEKALYLQQLQKIRESLEEYQPVLPKRDCPGQTPAMLEELGNTMLNLYNNVQLLIPAATRMLDTMGYGIEKADQSAAQLGR